MVAPEEGCSRQLRKSRIAAEDKIRDGFLQETHSSNPLIS
jgi:hypothetical protein